MTWPGLVTIMDCRGTSYGKNSLSLKLQSKSPKAVNVLLLSGTIFEHIKWVHKQNLMVIADRTISLYPNETVSMRVGAHCMNLSCNCSEGENMYLTDLYMDQKKVV